jgi:hypothetical protein
MAPAFTRTWFDAASTEPQSEWPNNSAGTAWFDGGEYHLFARQPGRFVAIGAPINVPLRDVTVTARIRKADGPAGGGYGIIVRDESASQRDGVSQQGRFYVLAAGDHGEFGIWRRDGDRWIDIIAWSPTEAVQPGDASNELMVLASGEQLRLLINGTEVAAVTDGNLREGRVGLFVGGDLNEAIVEQFVVETRPADVRR